MAKINKNLPRPYARPGQKNTMAVAWYGDEIQKAIFDEVNAALFAACELFLNAAIAKAPRDKGNLHDSGYVATKDKSTYNVDPKHNEKEVRPKNDGLAVAGFAAPHGHLVEFGTVNMAAQPFFRPAFDENRREMGFAAAGFLRKAVEEKVGID